MPHPGLSVLFLLSCAVGSETQTWGMDVPPEVRGIKGQNVILPCSFTHPKQQSFNGEITVKWIYGPFNGKTIFQCSMKNNTHTGSGNCFGPMTSNRYSLSGNPKQGNLSLHIQGLQLTDNAQHYCRVELDRNKMTMFQTRPGTLLNVSAPAQILRLSRVKGSPPSNASLECQAEGNPRPLLTWQCAVGSPDCGHAIESFQQYQVISRIPLTSPGIYSCRVANPLGAMEETYPEGRRLRIRTPALAVTAVFVALGCVSALSWLVRRGAGKCPPQRCSAKRSKSEQARGSMCSTADLELVYAINNSPRVTQGQTSPVEKQDSGIIYADVVL